MAGWTAAEGANDGWQSRCAVTNAFHLLRHGLGCGVGRTLGSGEGLGVGVGRTVAVGVAVTIGVGVGVPPPWPGAWISTVIGEPVLK